MAGGRLAAVGDANVDAATRRNGSGALPAPRRNRNLTGALLGALLVVFCATAVGVFAANAGHRHPVLVVARSVNAGSVITDADLAEARISADPAVHSVPASERDRIVGRVAGVNLVPGTLVTSGELSTGARLEAGLAVVGLALKPGQLPSGLRPLDPVMLVTSAGPTAVTASAAAGAESSEVLVPRAVVYSIQPAPDGQTTVVSVRVEDTEAAAVAAAGGRGEVSLVLLGQGGSG